MLTFKTLENTSLQQITLTFNEAFKNYFFPIVFTEEMFASKFAAEGGRLDLSVGTFDQNKLVAFILHFVDDKDGETLIYNGGTGVLETHRGKQLTSRMYEFILPKLRAAKVTRMVLEVLTQNTPAIAVYKKNGFQIGREFWCFSGSLRKLSKEASLPHGYTITISKTYDWSLLKTFWDYAPSWQNSIATIENIRKDCRLITVVDEKRVRVSYAIFNAKKNRIHQLAVAKTHRRRAIGSCLLNFIANLTEGNVSILNVDTKIQGAKDLLEKAGLKNFTNQLEMEVKLTGQSFISN